MEYFYAIVICAILAILFIKIFFVRYEEKDFDIEEKNPKSKEENLISEEKITEGEEESFNSQEKIKNMLIQIEKKFEFERELERIIKCQREKELVMELISYEPEPIFLNVDLYSITIFRDSIIRNAYEKLAENKSWLNEPFHASIVKILYYADKNNFWIKSLKSRELIINIRGENAEKLNEKALHAIDIKELLSKIVIKILTTIYKDLNAQSVEIFLLSLMIYALSKSDNLDYFREKNQEEIALWSDMVEIFCSEFSDEDKKKIIPLNNPNFGLMREVYASVMDDADEHPNYLGNSYDIENQDIKILENLDKKRLSEVAKR